MNLKKCCSVFVCLVLGVVTVFAQQVVPQFQNNDRVCFVGDSITHGGDYHSQIYLYYITRFPERNITIFNRGISGNVAGTVLNRFDRDIRPTAPTVSTLMLGMNDVNRNLYSKEQATDETIAKRKENLDKYYGNMAKVVSRIESMNSNLIILTPTIYDQTMEAERFNNFGTNDALAQCSTFLKDTAKKKGYSYVDLFDIMNKINLEVQKNDIKATIIGADRIHPKSNPGHFIMAYAFLKAQDVPKYVSKVELNASNKNEINLINCRISELNLSADKVTFDLLEKSLPYPLVKANDESIKLVPFVDELNQQVLIVKNLDNAKYALTINDIKVGEYTAEELTNGINLAVNTLTPQYKQALAVKEVNDARNHAEAQLRNYYHVVFGALAGVELTDDNEIKEYLAAKLKEREGNSNYNYHKMLYENYFKIKPEVKNLEAKIIDKTKEIYQINVPQKHTYKLTKTL